jgi:transcriptional regulator with XRE-family HTH domain
MTSTNVSANGCVAGALKMGLSQTELGAAAGVTFQQAQKYEKGANRISASRMIQFAERLGVAPAYFVAGFGGGSKANRRCQQDGPRH